MNSLQSVVLTLSLSYALIGALLLIVLVYARLHWSAKAVAVVVTSAFYIASFVGVRGLLGWASVDRLPASFQIAAGPHRRAALAGGRSGLDLSLGRDARRRQSAERRPRAYRIPYSDRLAEKTDKAAGEIAAGRPQGGRAADFGDGGGSVLQAAREYITPSMILDTSGGDPSTGGGLLAAPRRRRRGVVYAAAPAANAARRTSNRPKWGQGAVADRRAAKGLVARP